MKITSTAIEGVFIIEPSMKSDERGFFARTWDPVIAKDNSLLERFDYSCVSGNEKKGTLRGIHYQLPPHGETKLVRCTKGKMFDVVVDLRSKSKTFKKWISEELSQDNHRALYIPIGCAHGFLTLADDTEVLYMITGSFDEAAARGVRWNDPAFAISWPMEPMVLADRDSAFADFSL